MNLGGRLTEGAGLFLMGGIGRIGRMEKCL